MNCFWNKGFVCFGGGKKGALKGVNYGAIKKIPEKIPLKSGISY